MRVGAFPQLPDRRALRLYARTHGATAYVACWVAACVTLRVSLENSVAIGDFKGAATTSASSAVVMVLGLLAGSTWSSRVKQNGGLLTRWPFAVRFAHPVVVTGFTVATCLLVVMATRPGPETVVQNLRAILFWSGLALLSAVYAGGSFSWVLPVAYWLALVNIGYDLLGRPYWWNIPFRDPGDPASWAVAVGTLVAAMGSAWWRLLRG